MTDVLGRSPHHRRIDEESAQRAQVNSAWAAHQVEIDDLLASIHTSEIEKLVEQFEREHPSPGGRRRNIDPKVNRAFREWLWTWARRDSASKEIVK